MERIEIKSSTEYIPSQDMQPKDLSSLVALIDADYFKYLVASYVEKRLQGGYRHSNYLVHEAIDYYLEREVFGNYKAKHYLFLFSAPSKNVFRNHIAQEKEYKGNRKNKTDRNYYDQKYDDMKEVYTYINSRYQVLAYEDLEADDLLSMMQVPNKTFIHSIDKDLKQVPGFHFNLKTRFLEETTKEQGFDLLIGQVALGDTIDNIPGLYRFGETALDKLKSKHTGQALLFNIINEFQSKMGMLEGLDAFVEMYGLVAMKIKRGKFFQEKYKEAFSIINELTKDENVNENTE